MSSGTTAGPRVRSRWAGWRELGFFLAAYVAYEGLRGHASAVAAVARHNAHRVVGFEGIAAEHLEAWMRSTAAALPGALAILGLVYLAAQLLVLPGSLLILWRWDRFAYRLLRTGVLLVWATALPVYRLFPTAPPRLAGFGVQDVVSSVTPGVDSGFARSFYNPYAAVPSLHVAMALLIGVAIAFAARRWWVRGLALAWPFVVAVAVIATGNHYLFDVITGAALALAALSVSWTVLRLLDARRERRRTTA